MVLFARPLLGLIHNYPIPTLYFFMGAVTGSVPLTLKQADIRRFSWKYPLYIGIGLSVVLLFVLLPSGALPTDTTNGAGHDKIPPAGISYNSRICTRFHCGTLPRYSVRAGNTFLHPHFCCRIRNHPAGFCNRNKATPKIQTRISIKYGFAGGSAIRLPFMYLF